MMVIFLQSFRFGDTFEFPPGAVDARRRQLPEQFDQPGVAFPPRGSIQQRYRLGYQFHLIGRLVAAAKVPTDREYTAEGESGTLPIVGETLRNLGIGMARNAHEVPSGSSHLCRLPIWTVNDTSIRICKSTVTSFATMWPGDFGRRAC